MLTTQHFFVRLIGLEPTRPEPLDPKSSASTNFATGASDQRIASAKVQKKYEIQKFFILFVKKTSKHLVVTKKSSTFASHLKNKCTASSEERKTKDTIYGALDERFSLWSAKPAKAVRLRHAPLKHLNTIEDFFNRVFLFLSFCYAVIKRQQIFNNSLILLCHNQEAADLQ